MFRRRIQIYAIESRRTLILATPMIIGQISHVVLGVIDSMMVGRVGAAPLAASAFANSIFMIFLVFGFGISSCISVLTSRAEGSGNNQECGQILKHGLLLNLAYGTFVAVTIECLIPFLDLFGQPEEVRKEAVPFLRLICLSAIPVLVAQAFRNFSEALGKPGMVMLVFLSSIPMNVFFNWILIYGNWGFPAMGLVGAGWATLISRVLASVFMIFLVRRQIAFELKFPDRWFGRYQRQRIFEMLKLGVPSGLQSLFEVGAFALATVMMGWLGTNVLAAHQIVLNVASLTFMVPLGLSFAVAIRIGNASGAGDFRAARRIGISAFVLTALAATFFTLIFLFGKNAIPLLYIKDSGVLEISARLFIVAGLFQLFDGMQVVAVGCLRGSLDVKFPTWATFCAYWVLSLPVGYVLGFVVSWREVGIWVGLSFGLFIAATLLSWRFLHLSRLKMLASESRG